MPGRIRPVPLPLSVRYAFVGIPVAMASLDTIENACIAAMLWTWPNLPAVVVSVSSLGTRADRGVDGQSCADMVAAAVGQ
jgi:hypothetical protein